MPRWKARRRRNPEVFHIQGLKSQRSFGNHRAGLKDLRASWIFSLYALGNTPPKKLVATTTTTNSRSGFFVRPKAKASVSKVSRCSYWNLHHFTRHFWSCGWCQAKSQGAYKGQNSFGGHETHWFIKNHNLCKDKGEKPGDPAKNLYVENSSNKATKLKATKNWWHKKKLINKKNTSKCPKLAIFQEADPVNPTLELMEDLQPQRLELPADSWLIYIQS